MTVTYCDRLLFYCWTLILLLSIWVVSTNCGDANSDDGLAAPTNIHLVCRTAVISWDEVDDATGYELLWRLLDGESDYQRLRVIRNRTEVTLRNLSASTDHEEIARQYSVKLTSLRNRIEGGSSPEFVFNTDIINPVAPMKLTAKVVSNRMLTVSWSYPSSLRDKITAFEVTYSLVSAYNTSVGMRTFAESDVFNTTETSFHFALISSVTNYIFTVTPYSATRAGDSARVLFNDFSGADSVEDPVIFFNLRLSDTSNNPSYSSSQADIDKTKLDLTGLIQSSIEDICQCTLPSYTLRGSMDMCDSLTNCAIYTGRLLGSDTASATEVFKMVEDWLATQNGSLLNGELSIDPDCPLRRSSPSDSACTSATRNSEEQDRSNDNTEAIEVIKMLAIGLGSGLAIIICSCVSCAFVCLLRKKLRKNTSSDTESKVLSYTPSQDIQQRHHSVVVERNPSYNHHHRKVVAPIQRTIFNGGHIEAAVPSTDTLESENPYAYTSLKHITRQAGRVTANQSQGMAHLTVEPPTLPPRHSQASNNEYVINGLLSPVDDNSSRLSENSTFYPTPVSPVSPNNSQGNYLSIS